MFHVEIVTESQKVTDKCIPPGSPTLWDDVKIRKLTLEQPTQFIQILLVYVNLCAILSQMFSYIIFILIGTFKYFCCLDYIIFAFYLRDRERARGRDPHSLVYFSGYLQWPFTGAAADN